MKKRNFITGFSAAFAAIIALASCGGVRAKKGIVLKIGNIEYTAEQLFGEQKTPASSEAKFNAVYKAAIRAYFSKQAEGQAYMPLITQDTKNKVAGAKSQAQSNADKNGTSYDTEWKKILSTNGVEDEDELYDKFEYDLQKSKFEEKFYEYDKEFVDQGGKGYTTNYDVLRNGGWFRDQSGNPFGKYIRDAKGIETQKPAEIKGFFEEKQPYHMKHILVKLSKAKQNGDDNNCTITRDEASKLYNIVKGLAEGKTFEQVSDDWGDPDDSAKSNHTSLGIMTRDTGYVNDFKLGVYLYEALYGSSTNIEGGDYKASKARNKLFGDDFDTSKGTAGTAAYYADQITKIVDPTNTDSTPTGTGEYAGIGQIPYGEVDLLKPVKDGGVGDLDSENEEESSRLSKMGVTLKNLKEKYLPRNVIFNKYFNKHNIMVITPNKSARATKQDETFGDGTKYIKKSEGKDVYERNTTADNDDFITAEDTNFAGYKGFTRFENKNGDVVKVNTSNKVLRDENGRVILVFRSGSGSSSNSNDESKGYQGIHFIVIERSPFIGQEKDYDNVTEETRKIKGTTTLNEYYTQYYPWETGDKHPKYADGEYKGEYKKTFTHFITYEKDKTVLKKRSDTVKTELKKADNNLNTYIFEYLLAKGDIKFTSTASELKIDTDINKWIDDNKRDASQKDKDDAWKKSWGDYYRNLVARNQNRACADEEHISQLVPEFVVEILTGNKTDFKYEGQGGDPNVPIADLFKTEGCFNA